MDVAARLVRTLSCHRGRLGKALYRPPGIIPKTGEVPPPISVVLVIRQTFLHTSCVMHTAEMTSNSYGASFLKDVDNGSCRLVYNYVSKPDATVRDRSTIHDGIASLEITIKPDRRLHGEYWTSRKTTGVISLGFRCREPLSAFQRI